MPILTFVEDSTTDRQAMELFRSGIDVVIIKDVPDVPDLSKDEEQTVRMCRLLCRDQLIAEIIWKEFSGKLRYSGPFFGSICLLCGYSEISKFLEEKAIGTIVKI